MLDPSEFLHAARLLSSPAPAPPTDAQLRRAVSTAYYALFHTVLRAAARRFMGDETAAGYALLYRSFNHQQMRRTCEELLRPTLKAKYRTALGRTAVSKDMQAFAEAFPDLQDSRHSADYDPAIQFTAYDVTTTIDAAELAIEAFHRAPPPERADILALLMVGTRA